MMVKRIALVLLLALAASHVYGKKGRLFHRWQHLQESAARVINQHRGLADKLATGMIALFVACSIPSCNNSPSPLKLLPNGEYEVGIDRTGGRYQTGDTVLFDHRGTDEMGAWHGVVRRVIWYDDHVPNYNPVTGMSAVVFIHTAVEVESDIKGALRLEDDWILGRQISDSNMLGKHIDIDPLPHDEESRERKGSKELYVAQRHATITGHYLHVRPATVYLNNVATDVPRTRLHFYVVRVTHDTLSDGTLIDLDQSYFDYVFEDGSAVPRFYEFPDDPNAIEGFNHTVIEINLVPPSPATTEDN